MPELSFRIEGARAVPYAVAPLLGFDLQVTNTSLERIHTIALRCQIQIEAARRSYDPKDQERMRDLFGDPHRWAQTLRSMLWTCTFDFNVAAVKYFHGLRDGEVPLCFQFSGTVFYESADTGLQVAPIPWDKEVKFRLPVKQWNEMMELYYPNSAWLCLRRDVFERLYRYKVRMGTPAWEETLEGLLEGLQKGQEEEVRA
jgi:hypothetical protein